MSDVVEMLETAYRVERTPAAWLSDVLATARPGLDRGGGADAYFVDCAEGFRAWGRLELGGSRRSQWESWMRAVTDAQKRRIHMFAPVGYTASLPDDTAPAQRWLSQNAWPGMLGVNAIDARGKGIALVGHDAVPAQAPPDADLLRRWARIGAHLATAARLLEAVSPVAEAVLGPDGRLLHAEVEAKGEIARRALRDAAIAIDRVRTRQGRRDPDHALEKWRTLVAGRWTLVDSFERDGRRYILARPNAPTRAAEPQLSPREAQAVHAAALGHPDKLIAYELGTAPSTVSNLLARARRKLGLRNRVELVHWARERLGSEEA